MAQLLRVPKDWAEVRERNNVFTKQAPKVCWLLKVMSYKQLQVNYSLVRTSVSLWTAQKVRPTAWKVEPAGCTYAHALPRKLGCSFVKLMRKCSFFDSWQTLYIPQNTSHNICLIILWIMLRCHRPLLGVKPFWVFSLLPCLRLRETHGCHQSYLAHTSLLLWGVVLIFPSVGGPSQPVLDQYNGTPSLTLMIFEEIS